MHWSYLSNGNKNEPNWVDLSVLRGNGEREAQGPAGASAPLLLTVGKVA